MCFARAGRGGGGEIIGLSFLQEGKLLNCEDELTKAGFLFSMTVHRAPSGIHVYMILSLSGIHVYMVLSLSGIHVYMILSFCLSSVSVNVSVTQYPK